MIPATYSTHEVAGALGCSHDTVLRLVRKHAIAHCQVGRKVRFTEPQVVELLACLTVAPAGAVASLTTARSQARRKKAS